MMCFGQPEETTPCAAGAGIRVAVSINRLAMLPLGLVPTAPLSYRQGAFDG